MNKALVQAIKDIIEKHETLDLDIAYNAEAFMIFKPFIEELRQAFLAAAGLKGDK